MRKNFNTIFLLALIILVGIEVWLIFKPFVLAIFIAFLLSRFFKPWYEYLKEKFKGRSSLASIVTCIVIFIILVVPIVIAASLVVNEAISINQTIEENNWQEKINKFLETPRIEALTGKYVNINFESKEFVGFLKNASNFVVKALINISSGTFNFFTMIFFMFFTLYYLFKDGDRILKRVMKLSPLKDKQEKILIKKFISISKATIKGSLVVAVIQGVILGILFAFTQVPSPAFWGFITIPLALIPLIGAFLIWLPAAVIKILFGHYIQGIVIIIVGTVIISNIDNLLRAKLVGNETKLHQLLVFFSTIGGIGLFGPLGFIIGPVLVVLFKSLMEIYEIEFKRELKNFNK
ncbi:MAG: AI-2E family transporter [Candidatus Moranbacteria bacterium]|nr:AI-2E family transporter [Candidatus Moranbacteria bacterium]